MTEPAFETVESFAKRTGLPVNLIRGMVRQGQLAHIKTGRCHVRICIDVALEQLRQHATQNAEEIALSMPVPVRLTTIARPREKEKPDARKYKGRPPDSVRLAQKNKG
jgi:hypothetical protein